MRQLFLWDRYFLWWWIRFVFLVFVLFWWLCGWFRFSFCFRVLAFTSSWRAILGSCLRSCFLWRGPSSWWRFLVSFLFSTLLARVSTSGVRGSSFWSSLTSFPVVVCARKVGWVYWVTLWAHYFRAVVVWFCLAMVLLVVRCVVWIVFCFIRRIIPFLPGSTLSVWVFWWCLGVCCIPMTLVWTFTSSRLLLRGVISVFRTRWGSWRMRRRIILLVCSFILLPICMSFLVAHATILCF